MRALSPQREWQPSRWLEPDMPASRGITHWHAEGLPYMRHARTEPGGSVTRGFGNAQVLDRALRTGAALLQASDADAACAAFAGDALDDADTAVNRCTPWVLSLSYE